jgi:hypothetical protein
MGLRHRRPLEVRRASAVFGASSQLSSDCRRPTRVMDRSGRAGRHFKAGVLGPPRISLAAVRGLDRPSDLARLWRTSTQRRGLLSLIADVCRGPAAAQGAKQVDLSLRGGRILIGQLRLCLGKGSFGIEPDQRIDRSLAQ